MKAEVVSMTADNLDMEAIRTNGESSISIPLMIPMVLAEMR